MGICVLILDNSLDLIRLLRYLTLLPFTPILHLVFQRLLRSCDIQINGGRPSDIEVKDKRCYARWAAYGDLGVGESYVEGWWDTRDLRGLFSKFFSIQTSFYKWTPYYFESWLQWYLFNRQPRAIIHSTEDDLYNNLPPEYSNLSGGIYRAISMGYYKLGAKNYDETHSHKMQVIASKLNLKKGMKGLDLGCGFGLLAKYLADNYSVEMTGLVNCTEFVTAGVNGCKGSNVKFQLADWRDAAGRYDFIIVIGLLHHVGHHNWGAFYGKINSLLNPGGKCFLLDYTSNGDALMIGQFMNKYIFGPDNWPRLEDIVKYSAPHLEVLDIENMKYDAYRWLNDTCEMIEEGKDVLRKKMGERNFRITYWSEFGCEAVGKYGIASGYHIVFGKRGEMHEDVIKRLEKPQF